MDSKQKGDDFPGSHVVGDRVGDKRVDKMQEGRGADYSSFQTTSGMNCLYIFIYFYLLLF
jgi:hypothetical protein